jgi:PAS domain S-box-containing protein
MRTNQIFRDKQWRSILGYGEHENLVRVEDWISLLHPDDAASIKAAMDSHLNGKTEKYEHEYRLRHRDGTYRWIRTSGKVTRDQDGQPRRWTGCIIDITDQLRTGKILQHTYNLRRRSDVIKDILSGRMNEDENVAYLSAKLGIDLQHPLFACTFLSDSFDLNSKELRDQKISSVQKLRDSILDTLGEIPQCVAWDCHKGIGVICQSTFAAADWEQSKKKAEYFRAKLTATNPDIKLHIGVSDVYTGIHGLHQSCRQALSAAIAARCQAGEGKDILHYREAGIFQFIPDPIGGEAIKEYIERNIGKLVAYDRSKKTNYLATLEALLRGTSIRETADKLFLHPKTVVFRQKRIAKILDVDLGNYQTRLALAVALQLRKLYG